MPVIAIVGRPNVGKSSLLNALVGRRISIVEDTPGVTRDRVSVPWQIEGRYVELVDTGGYGFIDPDQLTEHIRHQIELAINQAQLVLFVVDCPDGLTAADEEIASLFRRQGIKTLLVANKADGTRSDAMLADFARLGQGTPLGVSAMNGRNLSELVAAIKADLDLSQAPTTIPQPQMLIAIVGKRNAGKSTFVNTVASLYEGQGDRVIVSEVPGTTRDSIDVRLEKDGQTLVVIDTAGVRKKRQMMTHDIEYYSFHRAQRSIRRADVVLLLIDAVEPLSEPDKKLAEYIAEQYKPVVLVVNKWDLAKEVLRKQAAESGQAVDDRRLLEEYREYLGAELRHLAYAPIALSTATQGRNVQAVLDTAQRLFNQAQLRLTTSRLNEAVRAILDERSPSTPSGHRPKVYYAAQVETAPPTIVLVVNNPALVDETYQRFMINRLRQVLPYGEVPIRLILRPRSRHGGEEAGGQSKDGTGAARGKVKPKAARVAQGRPRPKAAKRKGPARGTRPR